MSCGQCEQPILSRKKDWKCLSCDILLCHTCLEPMCLFCPCHDHPTAGAKPRIDMLSFVCSNAWEASCWNTEVDAQDPHCRQTHTCLNEEHKDEEVHQYCGVSPDQVTCQCQIVCQVCKCDHVCRVALLCQECKEVARMFQL